MASDNIYGGSLLSSLANMFFKGIQKAFSDAVEYEEEMGVLKQVNRISLVDDKGKSYILTIKLAPVRDRENTFYVEAETDAPNLDVSSLNDTVIKLDNRNMNDFKQKIDELLEKNNLINKSKPKEEEQEGESNEESSSDLQTDAQLEDLFNQAKDEWKDKFYIGTAPLTENGLLVAVATKFPAKFTGDSVFQLTVEATADGKAVSEIKPIKTNVTLLDEDNSPISLAALLDKIQQAVDDFIAEYEIEGVKKVTGSRFTSAKHSIQASFIKEKGEVSLTAIKAATLVSNAADMIDSLLEDDEFIASIPEGEEQSFEISDTEDSYDVELIEDDIDTSNTYIEIFEAASRRYLVAQSYKWAVGARAWSENSINDSLFWECVNLIDTLAIWVVKHTDKYPYLCSTCGPCKPVINLDSFRNTEDKIDAEAITAEFIDDMKLLLDTFDLYYVNLEKSEQTALDEIINRIDNILTYV